MMVECILLENLPLKGSFEQFFLNEGFDTACRLNPSDESVLLGYMNKIYKYVFYIFYLTHYFHFTFTFTFFTLRYTVSDVCIVLLARLNLLFTRALTP